MSDTALAALAGEAGILTQWIDYRGEHHGVGDDTLRALVKSLELPCSNDAEIAESTAHVRAEADRRHWQQLVIADPGGQGLNGGIEGSAKRLKYRIVSESGERGEGIAVAGAEGCYCFQAPASPGYYRIEAGERGFTLAVAPPRCLGITDLVGERRLWGLTAQLYALRRKGDGGIGDFSALADFVRAASQHGADAVAVSPMHALFSANLSRYSPYSPSSRLFLNPLHVDPAAVFGSARVSEAIVSTGLESRLASLEREALVDWPAAADARLRLLRALFTKLRADQVLNGEFEHYRRNRGAMLRHHACYEVLHAHFAGIAGSPVGWQQWPVSYHDCDSAAVAEFAGRHEPELQFHQFLQWLAEKGLRSAQDAARSAGMKIGLIGDLAVGTDGGGSHAWSRRHDLLQSVSVGAPPDLINAIGQDWGLTTFSPRTLRLHGYGPFIEMLRAQLRHVGGLRIDHVIGMNRLWLVPSGARATQGAYLRYPLQDLLRLAALESWRYRAVLVGEDMGTVPTGFREKMADANIFGMRVLWFERDWGLFVEPARWPTMAAAMTSTHDLPTVAGWWQARDIDWRAKLRLFGPHATEESERLARAQDRVKLWSAFQFAGVASGEVPSADAPAAVVDAAGAFVAGTPSPLVLLPIEDALGVVEQVNIPGTIDQHPNWRRRLPGDASSLFADTRVATRLARVDAARRGELSDDKPEHRSG